MQIWDTAGQERFKNISDICILIRKKRNKQEIYENFKKFMLTFAMNRFSMQIGILKKETIYSFTNFFIEYIYKRYNMIHYCLTNKDSIVLETREALNYDLPKDKKEEEKDEDSSRDRDRKSVV